MANTAEAASGDYVQMDEVDWVQFPEGLCQGDIKWKLLHVSPEGRGVDGDLRLQEGLVVRQAHPYGSG